MDPLRYLTNCSVYSTITQEEDENAWVKARTRGIGGSDIGPICGVSPFTSARQIYLTKTGQFPDSLKPNDAAKERMHFGHMLEPVVADEYVLRTGNKVVNINATLAHKQYQWALANVDRLIVNEDGVPYGVLECKTSSEYMNDEWDDGDILLTYLYQLQWYLFITGFEYGAFACLVGGNKFYIYEVFRNDDLINGTLLPAAEKFWYDNVLALKEPEMQSSDTEFANSLFSDVKKGSEMSFEDDQTDELARVVVDCKAKIKELTSTMEEAQNRIKDKLQDTEIGYTKNFIIKWSPRSQRRIDTDKVKTQFPEIYEVCCKTVNYRAMTIKG